MTDTDLIRATWALAIPQQAALARQFYTRLFADAPDTRPLFQSDMAAQGRKLVETLNFVVDHLDDPDALLPEAGALAVRHVSYGVTAAQYEDVGAALIGTLDALLGADMTPAAQRAWQVAYAGLSQHMIAAAYPK
ncbi:MAG: globin domain-containing protein [Pseudomonadota bacterium]